VTLVHRPLFCFFLFLSFSPPLSSFFFLCLHKEDEVRKFDEMKRSTAGRPC